MVLYFLWNSDSKVRTCNFAYWPQFDTFDTLRCIVRYEAKR